MEEPCRSMIRRTFADLVTDLRMRRTVGDKPPVLLLGAGASVDSGIGAMPELYRFFGCADFDAFSRYIDTTTATERYRYLSEFLQTRKPADVSLGYQALASLCAQNYFDLVLTTNMDPLLDDALAAARLWRRDYHYFVRFSDVTVAPPVGQVESGPHRQLANQQGVRTAGEARRHVCGGRRSECGA